jgi:Protein of unknown function (DUF1552)
MFITRKHLSRRTVLRGLGCVAALPLLDAMMPAMASLSDKKVAKQLRFGGVYIPNGALPEVWHPTEVGSNFTFTDPMKSLEPFRQQFITVSGMVASGTPGPHLGASCGWLNGVGAVGAQGQPILSGKTLDQFIVDKIGQETPLPSIEVGTEDMGTSIGACDGYSCLYFNSVAWRSNTQPLPVEINPRVLFERMFGETGTTQQRISRLAYKNSMLDSLSTEVSELNNQVGPGDKRILSAYLDNVREVERRLQRVMQRSETSNGEVPAAPTGVPESFEEHVKLIYDLMHIAYQGDITRVFTFLTGVEASNRGYSFIGVPESHHVCSHHGGVAAAKAKYMKIVTWQVEQFAAFVQKLKDTPDGDGSLLDHSLLYFGGGLSNGNAHDRNNPPALAVGGANGKLAGNRHIQVKAGSSSCNFLLNLAEMADIELQKLGPSTGKFNV